MSPEIHSDSSSMKQWFWEGRKGPGTLKTTRGDGGGSIDRTAALCTREDPHWAQPAPQGAAGGPPWRHDTAMQWESKQLENNEPDLHTLDSHKHTDKKKTSCTRIHVRTTHFV